MSVASASNRVSCLLAVLSFLAVAACGSPADEPANVIQVGVEEGNRPPALEGTTATGEPYTLQPNTGGPIVLIFYRSARCGLCRVQLQQLQRHLPAYERQNARVAAITLDSPATSQRLAEEMTLDFPLVSVDTTVFTEWGVMHPQLGVPLPATYILDPSGMIHFRHIGRNASDRTSDAGLVAILEGVEKR